MEDGNHVILILHDTSPTSGHKHVLSKCEASVVRSGRETYVKWKNFQEDRSYKFLLLCFRKVIPVFFSESVCVCVWNEFLKFF